MENEDQKKASDLLASVSVFQNVADQYNEPKYTYFINPVQKEAPSPMYVIDSEKSSTDSENELETVIPSPQTSLNPFKGLFILMAF